MKKILCPTDFSDCAQNATAYAAKLAHSIGAELILLNVQPRESSLPLALPGGRSAKAEAYQKLLEEQSYEISRTFKISCYAEVQPSSMSLSRTIAYKANDYDLLVMGTDGADDFLQFLSGSNSYNAVVEATVPAIIVPGGCIYSEIKELVFAFDYLRTRKVSTSQLIPFVKSLDARLTILQIVEEVKSEYLDTDLLELQQILTNSYGEQITLRFDTVRSSSISKSIKEYVQKNNPDVLAICSLHRSFLGNLFHKSVFKELSSVLSFPAFVFHH